MPKENILKSDKKKAMTKGELEEALIDNFVNMQRVLTNLIAKFDDLSKNISKMLELFEIAAKSFADKESEKPSDVDLEFVKKLDALLDQNKTISKGIMLMEEKIRQKNIPQMPQEEQRMNGMIKSRPLPRY